MGLQKSSNAGNASNPSRTIKCAIITGKIRNNETDAATFTLNEMLVAPANYCGRAVLSIRQVQVKLAVSGKLASMSPYITKTIVSSQLCNDYLWAAVLQLCTPVNLESTS